MIRTKEIQKVGLLLLFILVFVFTLHWFNVVDLNFLGKSALPLPIAKPASPEQKAFFLGPTKFIRFRRFKCEMPKPCPDRDFAFKMRSGSANVIGPKICLEDNILMSSMKNNVGRGINIALVNGSTGVLIKTAFFDTCEGDVNLLINFLKSIENGTLVMMASFDEASTKLNSEARQLIEDFGSWGIKGLGFRENWIFVAGKGIKLKTPYEKAQNQLNLKSGWPDYLEMEGCISFL